MSPDDFLHTLMRLQFGLSASFHFLFVPLSIGLLLCMNVLQTAHVLTHRPALERAARFWGRFFVLVWATGILTGYPLRWQLADLWSQYLQTATPVLKEIFSIEGAIAPLMMASVFVITFLRSVLPSVVIMLVGWGLLGIMGVQALTILSVNAWMQDPAGVAYNAGAWHVDSVSQLLMSDTTLHKVFHTLSAALLSGAFFIFAMAGHFISQGKHLSAARASLRIAAWVGLGAVVTVLWSGHWSAAGVAKVQPMKFAAFEGHWKAEAGPAPLVLWAWPDETLGKNRQEIAIPYLMSLLSTDGLSSPPGIIDLTNGIEHQLSEAWLPTRQNDDLLHVRHAVAGMDSSLQIPGLDKQRAWLRLRESVAAKHGVGWSSLTEHDQVAEVARAARPPVTAVFMAFRAMVGSGMLCLAVCVLVFIKREALLGGHYPAALKALKWVAPLPWVAITSGWAVAELGRQPWTIYEHLPTFHASSLPSLEGGVLTFFMILLAGVAIATTFSLVARSIYRTGPDAEHWLDLGPAQRWMEEVWMSVMAR
jgi:cytochrome d ubiquinol oxidase subunit I